MLFILLHQLDVFLAEHDDLLIKCLFDGPFIDVHHRSSLLLDPSLHHLDDLGRLVVLPMAFQGFFFELEFFSQEAPHQLSFLLVRLLLLLSLKLFNDLFKI